MRILTIVISVMLFLTSCHNKTENNSSDEFTSEPDQDSTGKIVQINASFPIGAPELINIKNDKFWEIHDTYGPMVGINEEAERISGYYQSINSDTNIETPRYKKLEVIDLRTNKEVYYFDTVQCNALDSCKYRLPDVLKYECYYFVSNTKKSSYGIYGNILLIDKKSRDAKSLNLYYEYGGDQNVSTRYFYMTGNIINVYEGSVYDDGINLRKTFKISIGSEGMIQIKKGKSINDVKSILYINYEKGLSMGRHIFTEYHIYPDANEFRIHATQRDGSVSEMFVPYEREIYLYDDRFYRSEIDTFLINGEKYEVYRHIDYNCYDPFCSSKHNHVRTITGKTFFSPEFGILVNTTDDSQIEVLAKIADIDFPNELIIAILNKEKTGAGIVDRYLKDVNILYK